MGLSAIPLALAYDSKLDSFGAASQLLPRCSSFPHVVPSGVTLRELSRNATLRNWLNLTQ